MATLKEIVQFKTEAMQLIAEADGEITPEVEAFFDQVQADFKAKSDKYYFAMAALEEQETYFADLAEQFKAKANQFGNAQERLKIAIKQAMVTLDESKIEGNLHSWSLSKGRDKLMVDESVLPNEYTLTETITKVTPDKDRIKELLENGETIAGARLAPILTLRSGVVKTPKLKGKV